MHAWAYVRRGFTLVCVHGLLLANVVVTLSSFSDLCLHSRFDSPKTRFSLLSMTRNGTEKKGKKEK